MKTRFCPSPTGLMHFGNVRTALFNYLAAKHYNSSFLLRIEDTDVERSKEEYEEILKHDLKWLGAVWDEGIDIKGPHEPYRQSQRKEIYDKYFQELLDNKKAYHCFCSEDKLKLDRKIQRQQGLPPRYPGTCEGLTDEQIQEKINKGLEPTIRFKVPKDEKIIFEDAVKGKQEFLSNDIGDFIIRRANGTSAFMFCNAIDDSVMGVNLALRGEDHLTNTPRQLLILKSLDMRAPKYGHISLIVGNDGSPLSKRHGSKSVKELRESGFLAGAIVNYLARLGHRYDDSLGYQNIDDLAKNFSMENLSVSPAKYDEKQLEHWQKEAFIRLNINDFYNLVDKEIFSIIENKKEEFFELIKNNILFAHEALFWARKILTITDCSNENIELVKDLLSENVSTFYKDCIDIINSAKVEYKELCNRLKEKLNVKGKSLFMPLRIALTCEQHGPELDKIYNILSKEQLVNKFQEMLKKYD